MGKTKIILMFALVLMVTVLSTGCGAGGKHENIDAGMAAIKALDYNGALACFEKALVSGEDRQLISRGQGLAYMGLTQYEEAKEALLTAISYNKYGPDDLSYDLNYYLATAFYKTNDFQGAIDTYSAIIALKPKETDAYFLRGSVEQDNKNHEAAIADFDKAIALSPNDYDLFIDIYISCDKNGYTEVGQKYLKSLLDAGGQTLSNFDKGRINFYLQDYEAARNALEEARSGDTRTAEGILMLGKTYEALEDYNYASSVYSDYLKEDTTMVEVYNQLGLCKMKLKDYKAALEAFQTAMKIENNDMMQTLQYNEIVAYEYLEEYKQAAVNMEKYLKLYPDDQTAQREHQFLQTR